MKDKLVKVDANNYHLFDDMVFWRINNKERSEYNKDVNVPEELSNPNLHIYAVKSDDKFVAWISLVYIPKVGRISINGHIFVDELWVEPTYRKHGFAELLMKKADELSIRMNSKGCRLYVDVNNQAALNLYEKSGYKSYSTSYFMQK